MAKGPGLYTEIGKKTRGLSLLLSLSQFHVGVRVFVVLIEIDFDFDFGTFWFGLDLLYKDYQTDHKFTITTYSPTGVVSSSRSLFL